MLFDYSKYKTDLVSCSLQRFNENGKVVLTILLVYDAYSENTSSLRLSNNIIWSLKISPKHSTRVVIVFLLGIEETYFSFEPEKRFPL